MGEQRTYVEALVAEVMSPHQDLERQRADMAPTLARFSGFLPDLGVTAETIPAIEASIEDYLDCPRHPFFTASLSPRWPAESG